MPFHAVPSPDPRQGWDARAAAAGCCWRRTACSTARACRVRLKSGDKIEYCIEVLPSRANRLPRRRSPAPNRDVVTVMDEKAFLAWFQNLQDEDQRVKDLEKKQKGVFEPK